MATQTMVGPVEYLVVDFPENRFTGEIAQELDALVKRNIIHVLDLVFITKSSDGKVGMLEVDQTEALAPFAALDGEVGGLISPEDVAHAAVELEPGTSAALLVWEDLWAAPFVEALRNAGAVLVEGGRIPQDEIQKALGAPGASAA